MHANTRAHTHLNAATPVGLVALNNHVGAALSVRVVDAAHDRSAAGNHLHLLHILTVLGLKRGGGGGGGGEFKFKKNLKRGVVPKN